MFKITGPQTNEKVMLNIKNIGKLTKEGLQKAFYKIGNDLKKDVKKEIMKKPKHGRLYVTNGRLHRASAPGEAPANLSGALEKAIDFDVVGNNKLDFGVRANVKYGKDLEIGSKRFISGNFFGGTLEVLPTGQTVRLRPGVKPVLPRPYLLPAIKKNFSKMETHFEDQIKNSITDK